jgi:hypothetical protein
MKADPMFLMSRIDLKTERPTLSSGFGGRHNGLPLILNGKTKEKKATLYT